MTRKYAPIVTAIWRDEHFRALTAGAQRTYLLLVSQPDISAAGTLALTLRRWAAMAADTTSETFRADLTELERARFVVIDEHTEELLVRSFVKWDGGAGNVKRKPVIKAAAREVESITIRRALAVEFDKLGLPSEWLPDALSDTHSRSGTGHRPASKHSPAIWETDNSDGDEGGAAFSQANSLSVTHGDSPSDGQSRFDRVVVTQGPYSQPQPTTRNPQPVPPPAGTASPRTPNGADTVVAAYIDGATNAGLDRPAGNLPARVGRDAKRLLAEGVPLDKLTAAATAMGAAGWHDLAVQLQRTSAGRNGSRASPNAGAYEPYFNPDPSEYARGYKLANLDGDDDLP
jgi:hypothetical protein